MLKYILSGVMILCTTVSVTSALDYVPTLTGSALNDQCKSHKTALHQLIQTNLETIKNNWNTFDTNHPKLHTFFKNSLSASDKRLLQNARIQHRLELLQTQHEFMLNYFKTLDNALIASTVSAMKTQRNNYFDAIAGLVDPSQTTAFGSYRSDFISQFDTNKTLRLTTLTEALKYVKHCARSNVHVHRHIIHGIFRDVLHKHHTQEQNG